MGKASNEVNDDDICVCYSWNLNIGRVRREKYHNKDITDYFFIKQS
ncbi:MAG: hypothetical protein KAT68_19255 [Bacteroidales bacterium]|nr:hypothetical protein [Bacteroidales bacterium]